MYEVIVSGNYCRLLELEKVGMWANFVKTVILYLMEFSVMLWCAFMSESVANSDRTQLFFNETTRQKK